MCPPGLHITLGVFYRLFVLLEEAAHKLDLRCAVQHGQAGASYEKQITLLHKQTQLKDEELSLAQLVKGLGQCMVLLASSLSGTVSGPNQQLTDLWIKWREKTQQRKQVVISCHTMYMVCNINTILSLTNVARTNRHP